MTPTQRQFPDGTLLLDPGGPNMRPKVWTVVGAKTLLHFSEAVVQRATLTKAGLPEGWQVVENLSLARHLNALAGHDRVLPTGRILIDG